MELMNKAKNLTFEKFKDKVYNLCCYVEDHKSLFLPPLLLILLIIACYTKDDNDVYFLYENGKEVINNGIPYYDWISIHDGLQIVLQQWMVSVIDYLIIDNFGQFGIQLYITIVQFIIGLSFLYLSYTKTHSVLLSTIIIVLPLYSIFAYTGNARPQLWSLLIICWLLIFIVKYNDKKDIRWLIPIPILSLALANFHATFWTAFIAVVMAYFAWFYYKNRDKRTLCKLALILLVSIAVGFINPYGLKALISPYLTIGHKGYDKITELMPPDVVTFAVCYMFLLVIFLLLCVYRSKNKKNSLFVIDTILMSLVFLYSCMIFRTMIFYLLFISICLSDILVLNYKPKPEKINDIKPKLEIAALCFLLLVVTISQFNRSTDEFMERRELLVQMQEVVDFLEETDDDLENKTVFSSEMGFGNFAYNKTGLRPYVDGRFENYIIEFNGKKDYLNEMIELTESGTIEEMRDRLYNFVEDNKFDYVVLADRTTMNMVFYGTPNYELVYCQTENNNYSNFYVYKRIEQ